MPMKNKSLKNAQTSNGKNHRQKKVKKEGPKKALTAYMLFSMERREQIVKDKPELRSNVTEMSKIIGAEWRQMSAEEKQPYQEEHERAKERYLKEKEIFDQHGVLPSNPSTNTVSVQPKSNSDLTLDEDEEEDEEEEEEDSTCVVPEHPPISLKSSSVESESNDTTEIDPNAPVKRRRKDTHDNEDAANNQKDASFSNEMKPLPFHKDTHERNSLIYTDDPHSYSKHESSNDSQESIDKTHDLSDHSNTDTDQ